MRRRYRLVDTPAAWVCEARRVCVRDFSCFGWGYVAPLITRALITRARAYARRKTGIRAEVALATAAQSSRCLEGEGVASGVGDLDRSAWDTRRVPDADTRWSRGERVGCGCFLMAIGSVVTFFGLVWTALDGYYGESGRLAEAVLFAGLVAGGLGMVLIVWLPRA